MHALECILVDFGVRRDLWIFQVGFDEELLCGGIGYIQEVLITILEDLKIVGHLYMPLLCINTRVLPKSLHKCIWDKFHHPKKQSIAVVPGLVRISNRVFWLDG